MYATLCTTKLWDTLLRVHLILRDSGEMLHLPVSSQGRTVCRRQAGRKQEAINGGKMLEGDGRRASFDNLLTLCVSLIRTFFQRITGTFGSGPRAHKGIFSRLE